MYVRRYVGSYFSTNVLMYFGIFFTHYSIIE